VTHEFSDVQCGTASDYKATEVSTVRIAWWTSWQTDRSRTAPTERSRTSSVSPLSGDSCGANHGRLRLRMRVRAWFCVIPRPSVAKRVVLGLVILSTCEHHAASATPTEHDRQFAEYLWSGAMAERGKLMSGRVRVTGSLALANQNERRQARTSFEMRLAFADGFRKCHYNIDWPDYGRGSLLITSDKLVEWPDTGAGLVDIKTKGDGRAAFARPIDPRIAGFLDLWHVSNCVELPRLDKEIRESLRNLESLSETADGVYDITSVHHVDEKYWVKAQLTINEGRGFTPEALTCWLSRDGQVWSVPFQQNRSHWSEREGIWIPLSQEADERTVPCQLRVEFEWDYLNSSVDETAFQIDHIGAPDGTLVVDHRLNPPVVVGKIGAMGTRLTVPDGNYRLRLRWLFFAVVLVAAGLILAWRRLLGPSVPE